MFKLVRTFRVHKLQDYIVYTINPRLFIRVQCLIATVLVVVVVGDDAPVITNFYNELNEDGSFRFGYDTSNNIYVREQGIGGKGSSGSLAYYAPDGTPIQLTWTADENGFRPQGAHLPTPPPVPKTIMSALDYLRYNQKSQQQQQPQPQVEQPAQQQQVQQPQQQQQVQYQQQQYQQYQQQSYQQQQYSRA